MATPATKLEIDFLEETDHRCAHLYFRQEGVCGLKLPLPWLPEMLQALESQGDSDVNYFWQNTGVRNTRTTCALFISTRDDALLQLSSEQRAKLIVHLRTAYAAWL